MRVRVVDKILPQGLNDNTALGIVYTGTWTPQFEAAAYANTLHRTTDVNARARFNFTGDSFAIGYFGSGATGAITVTIDVDGSNSFSNIYSTTGLTCSAVTPAAGNPIQTASSGRHIIRCSGLDAIAPGEVRTVRIDNDSANAFRLDWVEINVNALGLGFYNDTDLRPYLFNTVYSTNPASSGGTWEFFNSVNSRITFTVQPTVQRIMVYRPMNVSRDDLRIAMSGPNCTAFTVDAVGVAADLMWNNPHTIALNGCTNVTITRVFNPARPDDTGVDGIRLIGAPQTLGVGSYHTADLVDLFTGRNGEVKNASAQQGRATRLMDGLFTFKITPDVQRMVLYRHNFQPRNPIRIRVIECSNPSHEQYHEITSQTPPGYGETPSRWAISAPARASR